MAEIVHERDRLGQILIEAHGPRQRPGDLRHLDRMCQPRAIMVTLMRDEHLCLVLQPPERR